MLSPSKSPRVFAQAERKTCSRCAGDELLGAAEREQDTHNQAEPLGRGTGAEAS